MPFRTLGYVGEVVLVLALVSSGCETAADQQEQANEARAAAEAEKREAQRALDEEKARAQAALARAENEVDAKVADAQADFAKIREDFRHDVQEDLVTLQQELTQLEIKGRTAQGRQKAKIESALPKIREARRDFDEALRRLESATAATWDDNKTIVQKEFNELQDLVHQADSPS